MRTRKLGVAGWRQQPVTRGNADNFSFAPTPGHRREKLPAKAEVQRLALRKKFKIKSLSLINGFWKAQRQNCGSPETVMGKWADNSVRQKTFRNDKRNIDKRIF